MNINPNLLALIVAAIWGMAPIFEKLSLKVMSPIYVLTIRFFLVACLLIPLFVSTNHISSLNGLNFKN